MKIIELMVIKMTCMSDKPPFWCESIVKRKALMPNPKGAIIKHIIVIIFSHHLLFSMRSINS